ncbi:helix-turn-helix domain-containing protein [Intrasporangium calvum]|uniref:Helix-turn-helix domain-containing protein n=1 Tax=Intrasporangium calvum TaxID=53358 RepID=A0ABT5GDM9_9MICO|nr:winged helix-turn-helix domain-containing protein [Intrasporangium calvum]MDC5696366.1 helix-turn-helix domain-containing protein [Intrasporangium calvum]
MATPRRRPTRALEVDDPRALRALSHPARQRIINELLAGRVMTATEAAELVGLTPSAVSHHLRALERYGIAERAEGAGDARTRPWRSRFTELSYAPKSPDGVVVANAVVRGELARLAHNIATQVAASEAAAQPGSGKRPGPRDNVGISISETWLTDEERREVVARIEDLLRGLPERHSGNAPEGATRMSLVLSFVPVAPDSTD